VLHCLTCPMYCYLYSASIVLFLLRINMESHNCREVFSLSRLEMEIAVDNQTTERIDEDRMK